MTLQVPDVFYFDGETFEVIAEFPQIVPMDVIGLEPMWICSDCWRGYIVTYGLKFDGLVVRDFQINLYDKTLSPVRGPCIHGLHPLHLNKSSESPLYFNNEYLSVDYPIYYTGDILLARMFDERTDRYKATVELNFEEGILVRKTDRTNRVVTRVDGRPIIRGQVLIGIVADHDETGMMIEVGEDIWFRVDRECPCSVLGDVVQIVAEGYDERRKLFLGTLWEPGISFTDGTR